MSFVRTLSGLAGAALATAALALPAQAAAPAPVPPPGPESGAHQTIIDGREAEEAPWAARLFRSGKEACTASIIAPQWVLTAKHCVADAGDDISFHVGNLDQSQGEEVKAKQGGVHEHESVDLALVNIDRPVQADPAKLGDSDAVRTGQTVQTYGWGATCTGQPEGQCQAQRLKVADVKVTDTECSDSAGGTAVCAERGDGIPAGGDSGGPMFATGPNGENVQVGVASTSDREETTAYNNVTRYRDWIRSLAGV